MIQAVEPNHWDSYRKEFNQRNRNEAKGGVKMTRREIGTEKILSGEMLGDAKRIQDILSDWGMEEPAIERILDEHRAREARMRPPREDVPLGDYPVTKRPVQVTHPNTHSIR